MEGKKEGKKGCKLGESEVFKVKEKREWMKGEKEKKLSSWMRASREMYKPPKLRLISTVFMTYV